MQQNRKPKQSKSTTWSPHTFKLFFFLFFLNKNEFHSLKTHLNTRLEEENELFIHCIVKRLAHNIDIFWLKTLFMVEKSRYKKFRQWLEINSIILPKVCFFVTEVTVTATEELKFYR